MWHIEKPGYFILLSMLAAVVALFLYTLYWKRKKRNEFGTPELITALSPDKSSVKSLTKFMLVLIAVTGIIIALVNPQRGTISQTVKREGIDIVFAVDVSTSMLAEDVAPNRLEKSKQVVSQVINLLGTDRIGMIGYAGSAYPVLPMTSDFGMAKMYLQGLNTDVVSSQGTAIADAIKLSFSFFDNPKTGKVLVLISDGEDHNEGSGKIAAEALKKGIKIITIGVGTEDGGPIPEKEDGVTQKLKLDKNGQVVITKLVEEQLRSIAGETKGQYIYAGNATETAKQIKNLMADVQTAEYEARSIAGFDSKYQWFAGLALALLVLDSFLSKRKLTWVKNLKLFGKK
jgi:Ca-activated chloride channel family protein